MPILTELRPRTPSADNCYTLHAWKGWSQCFALYVKLSLKAAGSHLVQGLAANGGALLGVIPTLLPANLRIPPGLLK